jgi:uncharacterized peroxidase-related enzyme
MQRIPALDPASTTGKSKEYFTAIEKQLGMVPNMMRTMGNSPAVLNGYLSFSGALNESSIGSKLGELIAITVANANNCDYCNAAHSFIAEKLVNLPANAIELAREARSQDLKAEAALQFAKKLAEKKGRISQQDFNALKNAGYTDAGIAEIMAHVALNVFTNYFNIATEVVVDFPKVKLAEPVTI